MDSTILVRVFAGLFSLLVLFGVGILFLVTLNGALKKCSPAARTMQPGMVWLLLIPVFSLVWSFLVVTAVARSLANEFRSRNLPLDEAEPGKSIGIAMSVCQLCSIIPFVNFIAAPASLILWIVYWIKISGYSKQLDQIPAMSGTGGSLQGF